MISMLAVLTLRLLVVLMVGIVQISNRARVLPSAHCRRPTFPVSPSRIGT